MKNIFKLTTLLTISHCLLGCTATKIQALSPEDRYTVKRISDGDTIVVIHSGVESRVRFACIDAPEIPHSEEDRNSQNPGDVNQFYWGRQAKKYLQTLIKPGDSIYLTISPKSDRYGRTVAEVRTTSGVFIQQSLIQHALAIPYYLDNCPSSRAIANAATNVKVEFANPQDFRHRKN